MATQINRPIKPTPMLTDEALVEQIAFTLWKAEAERAAPNVAKNRTLEAFLHETLDDEQARWIGLAEAVLPLIRTTDAARIAELEAVLAECADDLEAEINARYSSLRGYPNYERKREAELEPVRKARATLRSSPDAG